MTAPGEVLRPAAASTRPTDAGRVLLVVTVAAFVSSWFGAGAVFALVATIGAGLSCVAWVTTRRRAAGLRVLAPDPATAWAREGFVLEVPVANARRRGAAFDVVLTLRGPKSARTSASGFAAEVPAGATVRVPASYPALRRGRHPQGALEVESSFPFGLFTTRLRFDLPGDVLVLPRLGSLRRALHRGTRERAHVVQGRAGRGDEQEYHGLRDWRDGESLRRVHWKVSARRGRLLVRDLRGEPLPAVHVVLGLHVPPGVRDALGRFEHAVSLAATLVDHHLRRGHPVRLTVAGREAMAVPCRRGLGGLAPVLRHLAEVVPERSAAPAVPVVLRPGERVLVVRAGGDLGASWAAPPSGSVRILDVADRRTGEVFEPDRRPRRTVLTGGAA